MPDYQISDGVKPGSVGRSANQQYRGIAAELVLT
jgi:hypothetical protein